MTYIAYPRLRGTLASGRRPLFGVLSLTLILSFLTATQPNSSLATSRPEPTSSMLTPSFADLPIAFVPNVGQSDPAVQFQAQGLGGMLFFSPDQIVLALPTSTNSPSAQAASSDSETPPAPKIEATRRADRESVVRLRFLGANTAPSIWSAEQLPGIVNYVLGNDPARWRTNVPTYGALRYEQLYPGIDLQYDGKGGRLKGTYTVAPGIDPTQIRWRYDGVTSVQVDSEGNLVATLAQAGAQAAGSRTPALREEAPIAWQVVAGQHVPVDVRFSVKPDHTIGFVVGSYDHSLPLVLDPTFDYSSYVGGTGDDEGRSIAFDASGAVYVMGKSRSLTFPEDNLSKNAGEWDVFVTKLSKPDPNTNHLVYTYTTFLGGASEDSGNGIAVGTNGLIHLIGTTSSSNFPTSDEAVAPVEDKTLGGDRDAFVTTLDSAGGAMTYSTYLGGTLNDYGNGIALDVTQNLYLTGYTESQDFPRVNARDAILGGNSDAFITKLNADKTTMYSTYFGGSGADVSNAIAVDSSGNTVITGRTSSQQDFPTLGSARPPAFGGGLRDAFVTSLTPSGAQLNYSIYLGGNRNDEAMSVAVDGEGSAYVTGVTESTNFPTPNGYKRVFQGGGTDAFVSKINLGGTLLEYSTYLGGTSDEAGQDIVVDSENSAYAIGSTTSYDFPNKDALQATRNGDKDAFVTKFLPSGSAIEYSTYFGGTNDDEGAGIATRCVARKCTAYITGTARSRDFPTIESSWMPNYNGGQSDAFMAQLGPVPTGPRLYLQPPMKFIGVNQTFSVDVMVASADKDIDTVDAYLAFNPEYLEVVDATGVAATTIVPASDMGLVNVNANKVNNPLGRIDFSVTKGATAGPRNELLPRNFTAATIYFRTKQTTTGVAPTTISLIRQGARQSDLYLAGSARNVALANSNIRILSGSILNGKLSIEQRGTEAAPRWTTALYRGDNNGIVVYDKWGTSEQQELGFFKTETGNNGAFSVFLRDIVGGTYDIQVKGEDTLSNIRKVNLNASEPTDFGTLCVGDTSGDNLINGADVSYIVSALPSTRSLPNYRPLGDTNKDNRIDREDLNIIKGNFLKTGLISTSDTTNACKLPIATPSPSPTSMELSANAISSPETRAATTEPASISLYPEELKVMAGRIFTVTLNVDLKSNVADTIDVYLNVNPSELTLVDKDGNEITGDSRTGELDLHVAALNNSSCEVIYNDATTKSPMPSVPTAPTEGNASITCFKSPFLPNTFTLATFYLKAKTTMKQSRITLMTEGVSLGDKVRTTALYHEGDPIEASRLSTLVTRGQASFVYAPIVAK